MGAWHTSLSANDIYADIYYEFFELYNDGYSIDDITSKIIIENQEIIDSFEDGNNVWFALAKAQWECKELQESVFLKVKDIIESGAEVEVWRRLGAADSDLKKRQTMLINFLRQLQTKRLKPKLRHKKRMTFYEPVFEKGDCLTFRLKDGAYGGVIVLESVHSSVSPYNILIVATTINQKTKPTQKDFENTSVLVGKWQDFEVSKETNETIEVWREKAEFFWSTASSDNVVEKVCTITVKRVYRFADYQVGVMSAGSIKSSVVPRIEHLLRLDQSDKVRSQPLQVFINEPLIARALRFFK